MYSPRKTVGKEEIQWFGDDFLLVMKKYTAPETTSYEVKIENNIMSADAPSIGIGSGTVDPGDID